MSTLVIAVLSFFGCFIAAGILKGIARMLGLYAIVHEGTAHVYVLFGKVIAVIREPGLKLLWLELGLRAPIVNWLGKRYIVDMRLDQEYLRSLPVNSEEGAPMGVGLWYEMFISDPVSYLFKNTDPRGSLRANVSNAGMRSLSNMKLGTLLEDRHAMSQTVRAEVSPKSAQWGYRLGSVYIRKVHFRDAEMIRQIEEKVVNRLRQVTSAIKQDGANQVSVITSTAEREAAIEFAKAAALRPSIVGAALNKISEDEEVSRVMFEILETQKLIESHAKVTIVPPGTNGELIGALLAAGPRSGGGGGNAPAPRPTGTHGGVHR